MEKTIVPKEETTPANLHDGDKMKETNYKSLSDSGIDIVNKSTSSSLIIGTLSWERNIRPTVRSANQLRCKAITPLQKPKKISNAESKNSTSQPPKVSETTSKQQRLKNVPPHLTTRPRELHQASRASTCLLQLQTRSRDVSSKGSVNSTHNKSVRNPQNSKITPTSPGNKNTIDSSDSKTVLVSTSNKGSSLSTKKLPSKPSRQTNNPSFFQKRNGSNAGVSGRTSHRYLLLKKKHVPHESTDARFKLPQQTVKARHSLSLPSNFCSTLTDSIYKQSKDIVITPDGPQTSIYPTTGLRTRAKPPQAQYPLTLNPGVNSPYIVHRLGKRYQPQTSSHYYLEAPAVKKQSIDGKCAKQSLSLPSHFELNIAQVKENLSEADKVLENGLMNSETRTKPPLSNKSRQIPIYNHNKRLVQQKSSAVANTPKFLRKEHKDYPKENIDPSSVLQNNTDKMAARSNPFHRWHSSCNSLNKTLPQIAMPAGLDKTQDPSRVLQNNTDRMAARPNPFHRWHSSCNSLNKTLPQIAIPAGLDKTQDPSTGQNIQRADRWKPRLVTIPKAKAPQNSMNFTKPNSFHKSAPNVKKTALLLKFESERWRIKASASGIIEYGLSDGSNGDRDCFAAWELTEHEVLQSCRSEDMLLMRNALSRSSSHSYDRNCLLDKSKRSKKYKSEEPFEELVYQQQESKKLTTPTGTRHWMINYKIETSLPERESKTHSVYTTSADGSSASERCSVDSFTCLDFSPNKCRQLYYNMDQECKSEKLQGARNYSENNVPQSAKSERRRYGQQKYSKVYQDINNREKSKHGQHIRDQNNILHKGRLLQVNSRHLRTSMDGCMHSKELKCENDKVGPRSELCEKDQEEISMASYVYPLSGSVGYKTHRPLLCPGTQAIDDRNHRTNAYTNKWTDTLSAARESLNKIMFVSDPRHVSPSYSSVQNMKQLFTYPDHDTDTNLGKETSRKVLDYTRDCSLTVRSKFIRTETRRDASDAKKCVLNCGPRRKTPLGVWKWRIFVVLFIILLATCHYMAFLATTATV